MWEDTPQTKRGGGADERVFHGGDTIPQKMEIGTMKIFSQEL